VVIGGPEESKEGTGEPAGNNEESGTFSRPTVTGAFIDSSGEFNVNLVEQPVSEGSSIISTLDVLESRHPRINVRPEVKLRAVMEIATNLARTLELDHVLPKILQSLFKIFPQADRGFVVLKDLATSQLAVKAMQTRSEDHSHSARLSMTILREALQKRQAILSGDAAGDRRFDTSESVANLQIRSVMCAPLVGQGGESLGVIQIDSFDLRQQFSQEDLDVLASVAALAGLAVENAHLHASALRQRDLDRELEFATQVQLGFLPTERPRPDGYEFYDFYEAAFRVGGDFFDYIPLPDGRIAIGLGDVAGKGVPAALLMARLYSAARYELLTHKSPADAMSGLNQTLSSSGLGHRFVTFVFAILDPKKHQVIIVNAGHLPPLLRDIQGKVQKLAADDSGLPLGIQPGYTYKAIKRALQPGDTFLLYTDGVTESMNPLNELYGTPRLSTFLSEAPPAVEDLGERLIEDIERFCEGRPQRDDICLLAFRRLP
jgi:serine phosphatase RsbU (regulator of sigma subunit)